LAAVGERFGVSAVRISQIFKAVGLPVRPHGAPSNARREPSGGPGSHRLHKVRGRHSGYRRRVRKRRRARRPRR
jgi:hypothetical protein